VRISSLVVKLLKKCQVQ